MLLNESIEFKDAKSRLQEALQAEGLKPPSYQVISNPEGNSFDCRLASMAEPFMHLPH